jgi:transposase
MRSRVIVVCKNCREGLSTIAIAKKYGVCHKTVRKWLKFYQIPVRSLSEARRNYFNRVTGYVEDSSEAGYVACESSQFMPR